MPFIYIALIKLLLVILVFFFAATLASAFVCLISRVQSGEKWAGKGRSKCDSCGHTLNFIDLIPVIGYLIRGGKCAYCKKEISSLSFKTELFWGLAAIVALCLWFDNCLSIVGGIVLLFFTAVATVVLYTAHKPENTETEKHH